MPLHRLSHITITVPEPDPVRAFYRDFGLSERPLGGLATRDGGEQLRIESGARRCLRALTVGVDSVEDLDRAAAALSGLGLTSRRSPDGLEAEEPVTGIRARLVVEPRLEQKPPGPLAINAPGRTLRSDARSPAVLAQELPRPRRLSHVVVGSTDAAGSRRFFEEGLGFRVSDEIETIGAAFLRCSTDHHNLLIQPAPVVFLHHSAWEMDDVDAVGRAAAARVAADPGCHAWGLGRHGLGSNYFWYLRDPAGNFAEYSSDLDVIADEEAWRVARSSEVHGLAAWGPPVPREFVAPDDVMALARGEA